MGIINSDHGTFSAFLKTDYDGGSIIGVNFFGYRRRAVYAPNTQVEGGTDISGRQACGRYWTNTVQEVAKVGGTSVLQARALFFLIVPQGE